ncbi:MAG: hypothetical protein LAT56_12115, partial [Wenzhouxiangella sp.]|nr:hypothetical protein [Wenzhouxiangella sp.]
MKPTLLIIAGLASAMLLTGCPTPEPPPVEPPETPPVEPQPTPAEPEVAAEPMRESDLPEVSGAERLQAVLDAQPEEVQARYPYRNPAETLAFFGIEPGMTVVEMLPGGGWYSRILAGYLGPDGTLIGANYPQEIWPLFGFMSEERITQMATWTQDWPGQAQDWEVEEAATYKAFVVGELPDDMAESADAVLMIRAMHNLARFEAEHGFLDATLADVYTVLKPGGIVGVVQHEARPEMPDDWATGARGYIKRDFVVERFEAAGFELVGESDINANPLDQPGVEDSVWRLPPSLSGSYDYPERRESMLAIVETHRMTL